MEMKSSSVNVDDEKYNENNDVGEIESKFQERNNPELEMVAEPVMGVQTPANPGMQTPANPGMGMGAAPTMGMGVPPAMGMGAAPATGMGATQAMGMGAPPAMGMNPATGMGAGTNAFSNQYQNNTYLN